MRSVYRVPRSVVSVTDTVYVANGSRLHTVPVELVHQQGGEAFISEGLSPGDLVLVTRLVNPLENSLLEVDQVSALSLAKEGRSVSGADEGAAS